MFFLTCVTSNIYKLTIYFKKCISAVNARLEYSSRDSIIYQIRATVACSISCVMFVICTQVEDDS